MAAKITRARASATTDGAGADAGHQLDGFIDRYTPEVAAVARAALTILRARFRGATELVYDNYNALAIGWTPTARAADVVCSIALYPRWVTLFFLHGKGLPDPDRRLAGDGARVRHVVLANGAATLRERAVRALIDAAIARARVAIDVKRPSTIVIKSIAATQRPRRPADEPARPARQRVRRASRPPARGKASRARRRPSRSRGRAAGSPIGRSRRRP